jgi:hypothetical protein
MKTTGIDKIDSMSIFSFGQIFRCIWFSDKLIMVTDDDRRWFQFQRERLQDARKRGDREVYARICQDMLTSAHMLVAAQRWWEIWSKEEACSILQSVFSIPPYLGGAENVTVPQLQADLSVQRGIKSTLNQQIESLETTKLVVQIVDYAATTASVAIGAGTATLAIRELVKKLGVRKAGEILAREFIKNQIKQEVQDKAIEGLAQALGADPATAHMAKDLVLALKDARKGGHLPARAELPTPPFGLRSVKEPTVSEETVRKLKQVSVGVKHAPVRVVPRDWRLDEALKKLPETERAVYELRAAIVEATERKNPLSSHLQKKTGEKRAADKSLFVERWWTGAVGRRVGDGRLVFASNSKDPNVLKIVEQVAKKYGAEVVHEAMPLTTKGHHAEAKILWAAEVDEIGATRAICHDCHSLIGQLWTRPVTPLK